MGPPQAEQSVLETLYMGCDAGYVFSDRALGGADVLATSYALSQAIRKIGTYDLIFCGKQTTDGDTAQVGAELAEHLDIPHLTNVCKIEVIGQQDVTVEAFQENLVVKEQLSTPCLLCLDNEINMPRLPSYKRKKDIDTKVVFLSLNDMKDKNPRHYGLKGSPTQVQKVFPPDKNTDRKVFKGNDEELTAKLHTLLLDKKFI
jgi:electron transfer flavoprotein beta subunit